MTFKFLFRGKTLKDGKYVEGSLVETTSGIKHKPHTWTKTWIVSSSFGNGGWFAPQRRLPVKPESVQVRINSEWFFYDEIVEQIYPVLDLND